MASVHEYYDNDFNHAVRMYVKIEGISSDVQAQILYDFTGLIAYMSLYVPGAEKDYDFFSDVIKKIEHGKTQLHLDGRVKLPSIRHFPGALEVKNEDPFEIKANFHGEPDWISSTAINASTRVFIYADADLSREEILALKKIGKEAGQSVSFRCKEHAVIRSKHEKPMAFISHDSRDKETAARPIALGLQKMLCPVWYDEFSLNVGDNLRQSIEAGLKDAQKCVVILSKSFLSNTGWTQKEFDSVFTRELIQDQKLLLPVWLDVTKEEVFEYCPSLANVMGLSWQELGEEEVVRRLHKAVMKEV